MSELIIHDEEGQRDNRDLTFVEIAARVWTKKWWVVGAAVVGLIAAVIFLDRQTFYYTASLKVTAAPSSQGSSGSRLGGLGGLASLAGLSAGSSGGATPFEVYLDTLKSEDVARSIAVDPMIMRKIFAGHWDAEEQRWREPPVGLRQRMMRSIRGVLGLPAAKWSPPDHRQLAGFLSLQLAVDEDSKSPIVRIRLDYEDPAFAVLLLQRLNTEADRLVRRRELSRARAYADYLERKLPTVTVADQRAALIETLSEQEKALMMASSSTSFAARIVSGPTVSALPTKPNGMMILGTGAAVGILVGLFVAIVDLGSLLRSFRRAAVARQ